MSDYPTSGWNPMDSAFFDALSRALENGDIALPSNDTFRYDGYSTDYLYIEVPGDNGTAPIPLIANEDLSLHLNEGDWTISGDNDEVLEVDEGIYTITWFAEVEASGDLQYLFAYATVVEYPDWPNETPYFSRFAHLPNSNLIGYDASTSGTFKVRNHAKIYFTLGNTKSSAAINVANVIEVVRIR